MASRRLLVIRELLASCFKMLEASIGVQNMMQRAFCGRLRNRTGMESMPSFRGNPITGIEGNPQAIWEFGRSCEKWSLLLDSAGQIAKKLDTQFWQGSGAEAFRRKYEFEPKRWFDGSDSFSRAADVIYRYSDTLAWALREQREAQQAWDRGFSATQLIVDAKPFLRASWSEQCVAEISLRLPPKSISAEDKGAAVRGAAYERHRNAKKQLEGAGDDAANILNEVAELAPIRRNFLENIGELLAGVGDNFDGVIAAAFNPGGALKGLSDHVHQWFTDPADAAGAALDVDGLKNSPYRWLGGMVGGGVIGRVGRFGKFGGISRHLEEHQVQGHAPKLNVGEAPRISGYHHRPGGIDSGNFKVLSITPPDKNGVYEGLVEGESSSGVKATKMSSFFPDAWSHEERREATVQAFEGRQQLGSDPHKWHGYYKGIEIQGYIDVKVDPVSAVPYNVSSSWPVYQGSK
ncbi:EndoU domain-containing protein [Amycolatopsis sp. NPDC049688]|uniref:EndoU domain-containing protein n=1 Tax=Amycolatopsis sp. NPDC049688 TaxID=3154733 RepID=UPI00341D25BD